MTAFPEIRRCSQGMRGKRECRPVNAYGPFAFVLSKESVMPKDKRGHGIVLDEKGQEQLADKERAQAANKNPAGPYAAPAQ